jgi:hypothetical protein
MTATPMPIGIYNRSLPDGDRLDARGAIAAAHTWGLTGRLFASPSAPSPPAHPDPLHDRLPLSRTPIHRSLLVAHCFSHPEAP